MTPKKTFHYQGFAPIDKLISQTAKNYKLENALYKHRVLKSWQDVAGGFIDQAKELTQAMDFKKGILTVACLNREVASQIKLMAQRIIYAFNQLLGRTLVYAIYLEV
jgi:hypothetical protein